ncbi:hypothetical protein HOLleu_29687 [Holothuria leucospilota]|uniref:Uncharacterized protein n=1 Tax=Holothuria leucospilota TaxID=206669 RepID=A0A9Q1BJD5_HOLLE|nr:hypothetical protein HOLleu_29687 [Holothuria leucospilota]
MIALFCILATLHSQKSLKGGRVAQTHLSSLLKGPSLGEKQLESKREHAHTLGSGATLSIQVPTTNCAVHIYI